jgi:hypothetical protein
MHPDEEATIVTGSSRLDDRILVALQEMNGRIAFSGLRRVLKAHPESLSRALHRLEREGLVERNEGGYRALPSVPKVDPDAVTRLHPIAHVRIPFGTTPESVLGRLAGHWFGTLRWVGVIDRPSQRLLAWARRDGSGFVLLGIRGGNLRVYVPDGRASDDLEEAVDAAYELLAHAVGALRPTPMPDSVAFLRPETDGWDLPPADN